MATHHLQFIYKRYGTPDNNGSERAIRNVEVKEEVSGGFRSFQGAQQYVIIRSIIDTATHHRFSIEFYAV